MLCRNICFPCRKKKACLSPKCNQEALCCNGCYDSDFPPLSVHIHRQMKRRSIKKLPETSYPQEHVTPTDSALWIALTGEEGRAGSSLVFGAEHLQNHLQNREGKRGKLIGPYVWGKSLYIMLIAHPLQLPFHTNYRNVNCKISISFPRRVQCEKLMHSMCKTRNIKEIQEHLRTLLWQNCYGSPSYMRAKQEVMTHLKIPSPVKHLLNSNSSLLVSLFVTRG